MKLTPKSRSNGRHIFVPIIVRQEGRSVTVERKGLGLSYSGACAQEALGLSLSTSTCVHRHITNSPTDARRQPNYRNDKVLLLYRVHKKEFHT